MRIDGVKKGELFKMKIKYLASIYFYKKGVEECFLGKRMSTKSNSRSKQNTKYLKIIEGKKLSKK